MAPRFCELRHPQVREAADAGGLLALPIGQTEEHGPHLPINTDTLIVERVCAAAIDRLAGAPPAWLLDPICYGYSQKVLKKWPGTIVLPQRVVIDTLVSLVVSLVDSGFRKIALVSFHGNHDGIVRVAARQVADERGVGPGVCFPYALGADALRAHSVGGPSASCHAGEFETSLMLHLAPHLVDTNAFESTDRLTFESPWSSSQAFVSTWTRQKSRTGTYGDPTTASAELGRLCFEKMVEETAAFFRAYHEMDQS